MSKLFALPQLALRAGRRARSWWRCYVVDRLFALREWLAEVPDRVNRRNRPLLDIVRLEARMMPYSNLIVEQTTPSGTTTITIANGPELNGTELVRR
jgi:hypothetical protein